MKKSLDVRKVREQSKGTKSKELLSILNYSSVNMSTFYVKKMNCDDVGNKCSQTNYVSDEQSI